MVGVRAAASQPCACQARAGQPARLAVALLHAPLFVLMVNTTGAMVPGAIAGHFTGSDGLRGGG